MSEALIPALEEALDTVLQALPGLGLTPFQEKYISALLLFEEMELVEGHVAEWVVDLAGSP